MTGPGTGPSASNISQACAACKHQRRKCAPDCCLAPFFPPNSHKDFLNSHKLFGVRNIMNTVRKVESSNRENAVKSMILEANIRARDPVGGCYRIVKELELKISQAKAELDFVLHQLAMFRAHDQIQNRSHCFYNDGTQSGIESRAIQQSSYFIGESSSNIGEYSSNKSIHMEALTAMKPSPSPACTAMKPAIKPSPSPALTAMKPSPSPALTAMKPSPSPTPPKAPPKDEDEEDIKLILGGAE